MKAAGSLNGQRESFLRDGGHMPVGAIEPQFFAQLLAGLGSSADDLPKEFDVARYPQMCEQFTSWAEAASNEHLLARRTLIDIDVNQQGAPAPRFSCSAAGPAGPPPQETASLAELGW